MHWVNYVLLACYLFSGICLCVTLLQMARKKHIYCEPAGASWVGFSFACLVWIFGGIVLSFISLLPDDSVILQWINQFGFVVDICLLVCLLTAFAATPVVMILSCRSAYRNFEPMFLRVVVTVFICLISLTFFWWMLVHPHWCDGCNGWH